MLRFNTLMLRWWWCGVRAGWGALRLGWVCSGYRGVLPGAKAWLQLKMCCEGMPQSLCQCHTTKASLQRKFERPMVCVWQELSKLIVFGFTSKKVSQRHWTIEKLAIWMIQTSWNVSGFLCGEELPQRHVPNVWETFAAKAAETKTSATQKKKRKSVFSKLRAFVPQKPLKSHRDSHFSIPFHDFWHTHKI